MKKWIEAGTNTREHFIFVWKTLESIDSSDNGDTQTMGFLSLDK